MPIATSSQQVIIVRIHHFFHFADISGSIMLLPFHAMFPKTLLFFQLLFSCLWSQFSLGCTSYYLLKDCFNTIISLILAFLFILTKKDCRPLMYSAEEVNHYHMHEENIYHIIIFIIMIMIIVIWLLMIGNQSTDVTLDRKRKVVFIFITIMASLNGLHSERLSTVHCNYHQC